MVVSCSGDFKLVSEEAVEKVVEYLSERFDKRQIGACLVVAETSEQKGRHAHYLLKLMADDSSASRVSSARTSLRNALRRLVGESVTCVDPCKGSNTWEKARRYLCKGYEGRKSDSAVVLFARGMEFTTECVIKYHSEYHTVAESTRNEKSRSSESQMELLRERLADMKAKGVVEVDDILDMMFDTYKERGWLCNKFQMETRFRTLALSLGDDSVERSMKNSLRLSCGDLYG